MVGHSSFTVAGSFAL